MWNEAAVPTAEAVEGFAAQWNKHEEQYYKNHPDKRPTDQPQTQPQNSAPQTEQQQQSAQQQTQQTPATPPETAAATQPPATATDAASIDPNDRSNAPLEYKINAAKNGEAMFDENSDKLAPEVKDALKETYRRQMHAIHDQQKAGKVTVNLV